ncbi:uncharacterized protein [Watersipora subatra]|uniref:uncharacterized protein n=1 Tax=Watersipora subatra TaxID=2589382 RepID=UPI00355C548A
MEDKNPGRWFVKKACFIVYLITLELVGITALSLAIFSLTSVTLRKLRIWEQFDYDTSNIVPLMATAAASVTLLCPIAAIIGLVKKNQVLMMVFCGLVTVSALCWLGIGSWCVTKHNLILNDIPIIFSRLSQDGRGIEDAAGFLADLKENMPLINNKLDFQCCQVTPTQNNVLCAQQCGERYKELFETIIFPSLYSVIFGSGALCLLSLVGACLVSCHLDDVNPAL